MMAIDEWSVARTKHAFVHLNGVLVALGVCLFSMGLYVFNDPHLAKMHGQNDMERACVGVMHLGAALLLVAALGCCVVVRQSGLHLKVFVLALLLMVLLQLRHALYLHGLFASADAAACHGAIAAADAHPTPSAKAAADGACRAFRASAMWTGAYAVWQQLWAEAMKPLPDEGAQALLQSVQDAGSCCGFGERARCAPDATKVAWELGAAVEPRQRCARHPGSAHVGEYCFSVADRFGSFSQHCSLHTQWDFAYGTYDGCQDKNQASGHGCAAELTLYMNDWIRSSLRWGWLVVLAEAATALAALRLLLALAANRERELAKMESGVGGGAANAYQTVPQAAGGVASGHSLSI